MPYFVNPLKLKLEVCCLITSFISNLHNFLCCRQSKKVLQAGPYIRMSALPHYIYLPWCTILKMCSCKWLHLDSVHPVFARKTLNVVCSNKVLEPEWKSRTQKHSSIVFSFVYTLFARQCAIISLTGQVGNNMFGRMRTPAPRCLRGKSSKCVCLLVHTLLSVFQNMKNL